MLIQTFTGDCDLVKRLRERLLDRLPTCVEQNRKYPGLGSLFGFGRVARLEKSHDQLLGRVVTGRCNGGAM